MAVRHDDHVAAQIEEARQLIATCLSFAGARTGGRRQIARDHADRQERQQRDPVLRIRNRQRTDWWKKEEIETHHRGDGRDDAIQSRDDAATTSTTMRKVVKTVAAFETCRAFLKISVTPTMAASPAPRRRN